MTWFLGGLFFGVLAACLNGWLLVRSLTNRSGSWRVSRFFWDLSLRWGILAVFLFLVVRWSVGPRYLAGLFLGIFMGWAGSFAYVYFTRGRRVSSSG